MREEELGEKPKEVVVLAPTATNNTSRYENVAMKKTERGIGPGERKGQGIIKETMKRDEEKEQLPLDWKIIDPQ